MPTVNVAGEQLYYYVHTDALRAEHPPLVLVHGAGGNLMHWSGELRRLPGHIVYALDLPGHGRSGGQGRADIGAYTEVVWGFASALGLPRCVLGGHSMGGAIAQEFALRYPGRLAGLVLVGTGARLRVAPQILSGILDDFDATAERLARWTHGEQVNPNLLRLYVQRMREVHPQVIHDDFLACDLFDRMADVARLDLPTLIVCGDADRMTPPKYGQYLAGQIRGAELLIVPGAGHMVMLEPGASRVVAEAVRRFVDELPPSTRL